MPNQATSATSIMNFLKEAPRAVLGIIDQFTHSMYVADQIELHCHQEAVHALSRPGNKGDVTAELFSPDMGWIGEPYLTMLLMSNCQHVMTAYAPYQRAYVWDRLLQHYSEHEQWLRYLFDFMADHDCDTEWLELDEGAYSLAVKEAVEVGELLPQEPPEFVHLTPAINML